MRTHVLLLGALFAVPVSAAEFTLEMTVGEIKKGSITSTYVVTADGVTLTQKLNERKGAPPAPKKAKLASSKDLEAALAELRASPADGDGPRKFFEFTNGCLREGETSVCTESAARNGSRLAALEKVEAILLASLNWTDFTLESASGEASRDSSSAKSTYVVTGDTVTRTVKHSGRYPFPEDDDPPKVVKLSNLTELEAARAAIRATKDDKGALKLVDTRYRTGCLIEGTKKFCSTAKGDGKTPRLEAIEKLEQLILAEFLK